MNNLIFLYGPELMIRESYIRKLTQGMEIKKKDSFTSEDAYWLNAENIFFDNAPKAFLLIKEELGAEPGLLELIRGFEFDNPLIVCASRAKENTKLFKFLSSEANVLSAAVLSEKDYDTFVKVRIRKYKVKITEGNFRYFMQRTGYPESGIDLLSVDKALWQLGFCDEAGAEAIDAFVRVPNEQSAFEVVGLIGTEEFVRRGSLIEEDSIKTLSAFLWALRLAVKIKILGREAGVSTWQQEKLSAVLRADQSSLIAAMECLQKGIDRIKSGSPDRASYLSAIALANSCF